MPRLTRIQLSGFKSVKSLDLQLRPLNVLIGVNGAGKSNLVSFFKMLNEMMGERLQQYIGVSGRAQSLLHFGPKVTPHLEALLEFETDTGTTTYMMRLSHAAQDSLIFTEEQATFKSSGWEGEPKVADLGSGHQETRLKGDAEAGDPTAGVVRHLLSDCRVFHFHDTSPTARARQYCYTGDNRWLMPDAGNLAAVLYALQHNHDSNSYRRILQTVRRIAPFFDEFVLTPSASNINDIIVNWRQRGSDQVFGPHQLSDGTLRAISLVTLLMQPVRNLPTVIVVDEPELGLHPAAKTIIGSLLRAASQHAQIIVATQSAALLDCFDPEDIVVVERDAAESTFRRLDAELLQEWLEEYSVGQLWEKNVLGGGPF